MTLQEIKENFIIDVAKDLFFNTSIFNVTIKDVAKAAGVGEMTIYRYFSKKQNIVLAVAMKLEKEVFDYFKLDKAESGYDKISAFYNSYLNLFSTNPKYFEFIRDFDSYMLEFRDQNELGRYEENIDSFKNIFLDAYDLGLKDGTIKKLDNIEMFYYSSTHSILELCKKLSHEDLLSQDLKISKKEEIKTLINIFLNYLRKE